MSKVCLTGGLFAHVDPADLPLVQGYTWHVLRCKSGNVYAQETDGRLMHRVILGLKKPSVLVDHKDGDGLNNRRSNLRRASYEQNNQNAKMRVDNTTGVKGVSFNKRRQAYSARVQAYGTRKFLGFFDELADAAEAVRAARRSLHGEFSRHQEAVCV